MGASAVSRGLELVEMAGAGPSTPRNGPQGGRGPAWRSDGARFCVGSRGSGTSGWCLDAGSGWTRGRTRAVIIVRALP